MNPDNEVIYDFSKEDNWILFDNPTTMLGSDDRTKTDIFNLTLNQQASTVTIDLETDGQDGSGTISAIQGERIELRGFLIILSDVINNNYFFTVNSLDNTESMESIKFTFDEGITVTSPAGSDYYTRRYIYYCPGGCNSSCGDTGTGTMSGQFITDRCYTSNYLFPEWCSRWRTYVDTNYSHSAYLGGTQVQETELYWEKEFKTIISEAQMDALESITLTAEVAYQNMTQFFCDQFEASCPMNGTLNGTQNIQLYNYEDEIWETVGTMDTDGSISDQQTVEVVYDGEDPQRFVDPDNYQTVKARMEFHWNGIDSGNGSAPAFMLIDYFALHLKW